MGTSCHQPFQPVVGDKLPLAPGLGTEQTIDKAAEPVSLPAQGARDIDSVYPEQHEISLDLLRLSVGCFEVLIAVAHRAATEYEPAHFLAQAEQHLGFRIVAQGIVPSRLLAAGGGGR